MRLIYIYISCVCMCLPMRVRSCLAKQVQPCARKKYILLLSHISALI